MDLCSVVGAVGGRGRGGENFRVTLKYEVEQGFREPSGRLMRTFYKVPITGVSSGYKEVTTMSSDVFPLGPGTELLKATFAMGTPTKSGLLFRGTLSVTRPKSIVILTGGKDEVRLSLSAATIIDLLLDEV